ncbi:nuclear transport factor 2 family protein [Thalassolituus sp.]|uniref:nuclear transport factor 2 family protein n=1 Tax=Thalassolituus sp. TaxID=2030822 RepID=UPI002A83C665|nr:nuclear transport factor 2 family protein [Thalassolituus sp.]
MKLELTKEYIAAFSNRNLDELSEMMDPGFVLEDPAVDRLEGRENVLKYLKEVFESSSRLEFSAKNIFLTDSGESIIEFLLVIDQVVLKGVDIIKWNGTKLIELRAYLDTPK